MEIPRILGAYSVNTCKLNGCFKQQKIMTAIYYFQTGVFAIQKIKCYSVFDENARVSVSLSGHNPDGGSRLIGLIQRKITNHY